MVGELIMPEYNLNNPSVTEEEQMIQDRIDQKYAMIEAEKEAYDRSLEDDYYKAMEDDYYKAMEEGLL